MGLTRARVTCCPAAVQLSLGVGEPVLILGCVSCALPCTGLPDRDVAVLLSVLVSVAYELLSVLTDRDPSKGVGCSPIWAYICRPPTGLADRRPSDRACRAAVVVLRSDAGVCVVRG